MCNAVETGHTRKMIRVGSSPWACIGEQSAFAVLSRRWRGLLGIEDALNL